MCYSQGMDSSPPMTENEALELFRAGKLWTAERVAQYHGVQKRTVLTWKNTRGKLRPVWDGFEERKAGRASLLLGPLFDPVEAMHVMPKRRDRKPKP